MIRESQAYTLEYGKKKIDVYKLWSTKVIFAVYITSPRGSYKLPVK